MRIVTTSKILQTMGLKSFHCSKNSIDTIGKIIIMQDALWTIGVDASNIMNLKMGEIFEMTVNLKNRVMDGDTIVEKLQVAVIKCYECEGVMYVECVLQEYETTEIQKRIEEYKNLFDESNRRKEERIEASQDNMHALECIPWVRIIENNKVHTGYIKDLSYSGIKIIAKDMINDIDAEHLFTLQFKNPLQYVPIQEKPTRVQTGHIEDTPVTVIIYTGHFGYTYINRLHLFFERQAMKEKTIPRSF